MCVAIICAVLNEVHNEVHLTYCFPAACLLASWFFKISLHIVKLLDSVISTKWRQIVTKNAQFTH